MSDEDSRRRREPDNREIGRKIHGHITAMTFAIAAAFILPFLVQAGTQDARWTVATLAACVLAAVLIGRRASALDKTYQRMQREELDFASILGEFIQLDSFNPSGSFTRAKLNHLCPDGGWNAASFRLRGRNRMRGNWKGCKLDSAYVDYSNEGGSDRDAPRVAVQLIRGQVTILQAKTDFPARLLLINGDAVTKAARNVLLSRTGLSGMQVEAALAPGARWQAYCAAPENAEALFNSNRAFVDRLDRTARLHFMLAEPDRVTLCGDYQFETVDYQLGIEGTRQACRSAMQALVEEGLRTVEALCEGREE